MKIAVIQATTQINKNDLLFQATQHAAGAENEVINFGVFKTDPTLSYVQVSLLVGLLLNTKAVDYVITGCSSGNGMAIACNSLPNVICGYLPTPSDAYLFGRINHGNCASLPLGLNFGWAGELNLQFTLEKLFDGPMNTGYPQASAQRKVYDTNMLQRIKQLSQTNLMTIIDAMNRDFMAPIYQKDDVFSTIFETSSDNDLIRQLKRRIADFH